MYLRAASTTSSSDAPSTTASCTAHQAAVAKDIVTPPATPADFMAVHSINDSTAGSTTPLQQQCEKRSRRRTTAAQLAILEPAFARDSHPKKQRRAQLAEESGLSERSVQIWFQNKRAKVRHVGNDAPAAAEAVDRPLAMPSRKRGRPMTRRNSLKRAPASQGSPRRQQSSSPILGSTSRDSSQDPAEPLNSEPDPVQYPTPEVPAESRRGIAAAAGPPPPLSQYPPLRPQQHAGSAFVSPVSAGLPPPNRQLATAAAASPFNPFNPFYHYHPALDVICLSVDCTAIGTWHRFALSETTDLYTEVDLYQAVIRTTFVEESCQLRITSRLQHMTSLRLETRITTLGDTVASLTIEFVAPPFFELLLAETGTWAPCHDFTENAQASQCFTHTFQGPDADIRAELRTLAAKSPIIYNAMYTRCLATSSSIVERGAALAACRGNLMPAAPSVAAATTGQPASSPAATPWTLQQHPSLVVAPLQSYPPPYPSTSQPPPAQGDRERYLPMYPRHPGLAFYPDSKQKYGTSLFATMSALFLAGRVGARHQFKRRREKAARRPMPRALAVPPRRKHTLQRILALAANIKPLSTTTKTIPAAATTTTPTALDIKPLGPSAVTTSTAGEETASLSTASVSTPFAERKQPETEDKTEEAQQRSKARKAAEKKAKQQPEQQSRLRKLPRQQRTPPVPAGAATSASSAPVVELTNPPTPATPAVGPRSTTTPLITRCLYDPKNITNTWSGMQYTAGAKPAGIMNRRGVTCYINACMQVLAHTPAFARALLSGPLQGEHKCGEGSGAAANSSHHPLRKKTKINKKNNARKSTTSSSEPPAAPKPCIACKTRADICAILNPQGGNKGSILCSKISAHPQSVAGPAFDLHTEHDTAEFRMLLLSRLREDCLRTVPDATKLDADSKETTIVDAIFGGKTSTTLQCACGVSTRRTSYAMDLLVNVTKGKTPVPLADLIRESLAPETIEGYKCDTCQKHRTVHKHTRISDPGANFTIQLGRWDPFTGNKRTRRVVFPATLDLAPYLTAAVRPAQKNNNNNNNKAEYRLYAVTKHIGASLTDGHYTASVKRPDGQWVHCDDTSIRGTTLERVLAEQDKVYTLHYQRVEQPAHHHDHGDHHHHLHHHGAIVDGGNDCSATTPPTPLWSSLATKKRKAGSEDGGGASSPGTAEKKLRTMRNGVPPPRQAQQQRAAMRGANGRRQRGR
ncbi:hypothetical protein HDU87_006180 [Geranomyces variabilis]|uniref:ubiquitinyl hydrolase 1 n=1 Tax=Geranomyces variabilis TaxID=109894 RepID=A0AAD5TG05_9FUNG|nr:hypothetical protein HDU87_006180 [Geranomyces variabilis]